MSKMHKAILHAALFVTALALSACASEPKVEPVAEPAPVEAPAPVAAPEPAPAPEVVAEPAAPKPEVRKARKAVAKPAPPPPVVAPAPVVAEPEVPAVKPPEPTPAVTVAPLEEKVPEPGFLEQYWLWLILLGFAIAGVIIWRWMNKESAS